MTTKNNYSDLIESTFPEFHPDDIGFKEALFHIGTQLSNQEVEEAFTKVKDSFECLIGNKNDFVSRNQQNHFDNRDYYDKKKQ